ncbi:hypothetical protein K9M74_04475 [Candidatus Woesearchaeota archaeon]|nr:hypothetical protein [Candidatus Woesearchaeota archaeon]
MSQDIISVENFYFIGRNLNREIINHIGKVKDRNDFTIDVEMGVSTTISYKKPLIYDSRQYEDIRIVSFVQNEQSAKTNVWGRPLNGRCLDEVLLNEFSSQYRPHDLPLKHSQTVDKLEEYHLELHKKDLYLDKKTITEETELKF